MAYLDNVYAVVQIAPTGIPTYVRLSQNENGRVLNFAVSGDALPAGSTIVLTGTKPDGAVYSASGTLADNVATFNEDEQLTAVAGEWDAKVEVTNSGNLIATGRIKFVIDADPSGGNIPSDSQLDGYIAEMLSMLDAGKAEAYGSPLVASTVAGMIDQNKVYVYTGSETGYTAGNWYYWNGSAWTSGGVYNSAAVETDTTLTESGVPADAKATGDKIDELKDDISDIEEQIEQISGLSDDAKETLLACFAHVAWIDDNGQDYYDALEAALNNEDYPMITVSYVSSGHVVHANDSLESLRPYLTVIYYETSESSGITVNDYTLSTTSPLIPGTNTIIVQYNGLRSRVAIVVANPIYEYVPPEYTYPYEIAKWVDHTQIEGLYNDTSQYLPVKGLTPSGIAVPSDPNEDYLFSYIACPFERTGRATSNTQIIVGNFDGKKIGLRRYTLSTSASVYFNVFYGLINDDNQTFSGYLVYESEDVEEEKAFGAWTFYNSEQTLPSNQSTNLRFVEIGFRKGDSSVNFTDAEVAELVGLLYIE